MTYRVGVDVGGSFTDFAVLDTRNGEIFSLKVFSRPDKPGSEIEAGLTTLSERDGISPSDIDYFTHGTTVGVNTVLQRRGTKLGLLTTRNFEDVLELARLKIPQIHNLFSVRPAPLISRDMVYPVDERTDALGSILLPCDEDSVLAAAHAGINAGCEGFVIAFLHSHRNSANELAAKRIIEAQWPGMPVFSSSEVWPIIREYERTITAVINGYVQPQVAHYLSSFQSTLANLGVEADPKITKSNGGVMSAEQAKSECVKVILSGTASGVIGASYIAKNCGYPNVLSLDIGGTSADVAVMKGGEPEYGIGETIGDFQIYVPSVSVTSIGQGGGSIAWLDTHGALWVGPESAGSTPGPACYGKGGERPTVTDAFAACGWIGHSELGYNAVSVDASRSHAAFKPIADQLGISVHETAQSVIDISISGMYADVSGLISRFGIDIRQYSILAFGGAGPMMACFLARELKCKSVIVPPVPGVLSAMGGLVADIKNDFIQVVFKDLGPGLRQELTDGFASLEKAAVSWLIDDQAYDGKYEVTYLADMRYVGQSYEIEVNLERDWVVKADIDAIAQAFHEQHRKLYEHSDDAATVQVINLRLVISGPTIAPFLQKEEPTDKPLKPVKEIDAYMDHQWCKVPVYLRSDVLPGHTFTGPAVVAQEDTTVCIPEDFVGTVDPYCNLILTPASANMTDTNNGD